MNEQGKGPLLAIGIMVFIFMVLAKPLQGAFGGGGSYKRLRALAKARRAKKAKARKRKRG